MGAGGPDPRRAKMVMVLRQAGVRDQRVLEAMERTPRDLFVPDAFADRAYDDAALPIECGQTISQPQVVGLMTEKLELGDRMKVLEIGTGSGYQAAILSRLARRVYTIERFRSLMREAQKRFDELGLTNVVTLHGDGSKGWPEQAPFDRIIVTAAADARPDVLLDQLKDGGIMIAPVGPSGQQTLVRYRKTESGVTEEPFLPVRFVPLVEGVARGE